MFAFEFEPQISFNHPLLAKQKIYFSLTYLKKADSFTLEERIFKDNWNNCTVVMIPNDKFSDYMDSSLEFLEVRNTNPFPTIEQALNQINEKTEDLALKLYETLEIPFAFILPDKSLFGDDVIQLLSKHLNIDRHSEFGKELYNYYLICNATKINILSVKDKRIHIKLPYRFTDYSLASLMNYLNSVKNEDSWEMIEKKYNSEKPEIIGFINSWGNWTWINKYY